VSTLSGVNYPKLNSEICLSMLQPSKVKSSVMVKFLILVETPMAFLLLSSVQLTILKVSLSFAEISAYEIPSISTFWISVGSKNFKLNFLSSFRGLLAKGSPNVEPLNDVQLVATAEQCNWITVVICKYFW
jgi:hypothetical protein